MSKSNELFENRGGHDGVNREDRVNGSFDYSTFVFDNVTNKNIKQTVREALVYASERMDDVMSSDEVSWESTIEPISQIGDELSTLYAMMYITSRTHAKKSVREAAWNAIVTFNQFDNALLNRSDLYEKYKTYAETDEAQELEGEQARYLELQIRQFETRGHGHNPESRAKILKLNDKLAKYGVDYDKNINEDKTEVLLSKKALKGMPKSFLSSLEKTDDGNYRVRMLDEHVYTILQDSPNRETRKQINEAFSNVAVEKNRPLLEKIVETRQEVARMIGRKSWAHYRLEQCMVHSPEEVKEFYARLIEPLKPKAEEEIFAMTEQLRADGHDDVLRVYDTMYYSSKGSNELDGKEIEEMIRYFPLVSVKEGMFEISNELLGLQYERNDSSPTWHKDVEVYDVYDEGTHVSRLYLDLFARPDKGDGTYHLPIRAGRKNSDGTYTHSIGAIMAEFTPSSEGAPPMLSIDEIHNFAHEMGHFTAMVKARSQISDFVVGDEEGVFLGIDYAEMTAQIFEKFAEEPEILRRLSGHPQTGKKLSKKKIERYLESQRHNGAMRKLGRFSLHYADLLLHDGSVGTDFDEVLRESSAINMIPHEEGTFFLASFSHLVNYSALTSAYDTSEVMAYDIFDNHFKLGGMTRRSVGRKFDKKVLRPSGTKNPLEIVRDILGRDYDTTAYLGRLGVENL